MATNRQNLIASVLAVVGFLIIAVICGISSYYDKKAQLTTTTPTTQLSPTAMPIVKKGSKEAREKFVAQNKEDLATKGVFISLIGAEKDIMKIESRLSTYEELQLLHDSLQTFRDSGFKQLIIVGKDGERTVDLEILDQ